MIVPTAVMMILAFLGGLFIYGAYRSLATGFYTVRPDERAVLSTCGRAQRLPGYTGVDQPLTQEERRRYAYPIVQVIQPGGPYFKWPWQEVHKVSVATQSVNLTWDPSKHQDTIEAVTKDNLTTGVNGQIRFRVCESNLYAYLFGVQHPLEHVMGYFISVLRERIANFEDPKAPTLFPEVELKSGDGTASVDMSEGVSINDLRKNLHILNEYMEQQCSSTPGRYGIELDAALITEIDPPVEVDRALSAINSTRNQVAADISTARADAEQQITMSNRAVDIASNNANAEVAPLRVLAETLTQIKSEGGEPALRAYIRNLRVPLFERARRIIPPAK